MSTRSIIAMTDGTGFRSIYCHRDGYPKGPHGVGFKLLAHWTDRDKVSALLDLGDISGLGAEFGAKHAFEDWSEDVVTAYGRDRGETDVEATRHKSRASLLREPAHRSDCDYLYVLFDDVWLWAPIWGKAIKWSKLRALTAEDVTPVPAPHEVA